MNQAEAVFDELLDGSDRALEPNLTEIEVLVRPYHHQPIVFQHRQRLSHRCVAHAKLAGKLVYDNVFSGAQAIGQNEPIDLSADLFPKRTLLDFLDSFQYCDFLSVVERAD